MSGVQFGITIAACTAATMLTRFLPFLIFSSKDQQPPEVVRYLGRVYALLCAAGAACILTFVPQKGHGALPCPFLLPTYQ